MSDEIKAVDYYTDPDKTVERLKETAERLWDNGAQSVCLDAAAVITRLQAEVEGLRAALAPFAAIHRETLQFGLPPRPPEHYAWGFNNATLTWGDFATAATLQGQQS